jgi:hypothetical protein
VADLEEFHDLGNGVTCDLVSQRARLASGALIEEPYATVTAWEGGMIVRVAFYPSFAEARAAAERLANERE